MIWYLPSPSIPQQQGFNAYDMQMQEKRAADEAARKSRIEAQNRQGSRQNLLTGPELQDTFGSTPTARKNLLGVQV